MKKLSCLIAAVATLSVVGSAQAVTLANQGRITQLDTAGKQLAGSAQATKGYPRANMETERVRINGLIDDLQQGRRVDPSEIDRALEGAERALH